MKTMIKRLMIAALLLVSMEGFGQYVQVRDSLFGQWLSIHYSSCVTGTYPGPYQLDTTCPAILATTSINSSDSTIGGVPYELIYFKNLDSLDISNIVAAVMPPLPSSIKYLGGGVSQIDSFASFPASLRWIYFNGSGTSNLRFPAFPDSLVGMYLLSTSMASTLPVPPHSLKYMKLQSYNYGGTTAAFPSLAGTSLDTLIMDGCLLQPYSISTIFPALPPTIKYFSHTNELGEILYYPAFPDSVTYMVVVNGMAISIPNIPASLQYFDCSSTLGASGLQCIGHIYSNQLQTFKINGSHLSCMPNRFTLPLNYDLNPDSLPICSSPCAGAAGPDQNICQNNTAIMAATGIGTWTALASNPATTIFTNQNIPTSIVSGFTVPGTYGFIWAGDTMTVTVNANTLVVTDSAHINAPCYGMNGSICLSVSGGTPNYSYQWNSGQTTPCITGVAHFSYIVTVTDQNGCSATLSDSITQPDSLHISFTTQNTSCAGGSDGSIIAIVTGGTPAYTYVWAGGAFSNPLTGLTAGNYCLTVSDNNACTASGCDSVRSGSGSCPSVTPPVQSCYSGLPDPLTQPTFTSPGFNTSDSIFPCISQGVGVADTIFFTNFTTFPSGIIMDSLVIDSIFLPTGLCWSTHESNNTFPAGGSESILISGSTFDSVGQYKLRMVVTAYTNVGTFTDIDAEQFLGLIYRIRVICYGSSCPAIDNSSADSALMYIPYPSCPPLSTDTVWPGDADANHLVDNNDLLPIGLGYDSTGPLRTVAQQSILWQADSATLWSNYFTTYSPLVNFNNADCNGDGVINSDDTLAIVTNFGLTHAKSGGTGGPWRSGIPALKAVLSADTLYAGDTLTVTFVLGDSANTVADFYGIAFTYNFDPLVVDSTFTTMSFNDSWVGTSSNKISISKTFTDGEIYAAVTRIDHVAVSGYGPIAMASFKITTDNISGKTFSYYPNFGSISAITAIDQHGNKFPLNAGADTSSIAFTPNGIPVVQTETLHMQPNPAHDRVTISAGNVIQEIRIIDIVGNEVINNTAINSKATSLNVSILSSGVYFVQVRTDRGAGTLKLVVER